MPEYYKCPVCGKPLTEGEFDKALGLWKEKQEHIKHLEDERKKLREEEKAVKKSLATERKKLKRQETLYKHQSQQQAKQFKLEQAKLRKDAKKLLNEQSKKSSQQLKEQRLQLEKSFGQKMRTEIKKGIDEGVEEQKKEFKKQQVDLKKTKNKMLQLENSLKSSAKKYEQANDEIKKLKEQIEKGITPQIEGLLEESKLLAKLEELFPDDKFEHPGKGGDIIQFVIEQGKEIGKIVYECKKVKTFNKSHVEQTREARRKQGADFAILVTNAFPSKKQYYFVDKTVFVISPVSLEPITYTLRESLVKMAILKMTNEAKQKAVQQVYNYLSSSDYNNKMNDIANQLIDLAKDLKIEIKSHKDRWIKRYSVYNKVYSDVILIDFKLKGLIQNQLEDKTKLLPPPKKEFVEIEELSH